MKQDSSEMVILRDVSLKMGRSGSTQDIHFSLPEFEVSKGEAIALTGPSGCGKSTLIKVINGVNVPERGAEISFSGAPAGARVLPHEAKKHGLHVIWQDLALFPDLTVAENISFDGFVSKPLGARKVSKSRQTAKDVIARIGITLDPDVRLGDLSIAKRQIVAICRSEERRVGKECRSRWSP